MLTCGLVGCGGSSPSSPSGPSATQPPPGSPRTTFGLSGTVTEVSSAGLTPLAGATVEILGHVGATNALGYYSLPAIELSGLPSSVTVRKDGYASETRPLTLPPQAIDAVLDIQVVSTSDIHTLVGVVSERTPAGLVPVEGALVTALSAATARSANAVTRRATTDRNGHYSLPGLYPGPNNVVYITKEGFEDPFPPRREAPEGGAPITLTGDQQLDIQLVRSKQE